MSGIDEQDRIQSRFHEEERIWEQRIADKIRASMGSFRGEPERERLNRLLSDGFRRYEEIYEECLTDVLQVERFNLNAQQIQDIMVAMATRIRCFDWSGRGLNRWQRFKRWLGNVWNR